MVVQASAFGGIQSASPASDVQSRRERREPTAEPVLAAILSSDL